MLSHIATDLHEVYLEEVFKPQLGKPGASTPPKPATKSSSDIDGDGDVDSFEKKVRQLIYDIRHIMRRDKITADQAFNVKVSTVKKYGADVIKAAKEKLGIKTGGAVSVSEESSERMVKVTINYKNGTIDRRNVPYNEVSSLRQKPTISSVEVSSNKVSYSAGEPYEKKYGSGGQNTVGDLDRDGTKEPNSHEYAGVKDNAIKRAMAKRAQTPKKKPVREGFSNWRANLFEITNVADEIESSNETQIKEKNVDNYSGGKNKAVVKINPQFNESIETLGGHLIESSELSEDYLIETSNIAANYFYQNGLNEEGLDIVIEDVGLENFVEFVFELSEEYFLSEELKKSESKVKTSKAPKGTKQYATTISRIKKQGGSTMSSKDRMGSTIRKDRVKKSVEKAKESQPSKKPVRDAIARGIFGAVKAYQAGVERHKKAMGLAKETGKTVAKAAAVTHEAGRRAGQSAIGKKVKEVGGAVVRAGVKKVKKDIETTKQALKKEEFELQEKAESEQQQKLFGLALSVKRGKTPRSEVSAEVLKIVDTMSEKEIRKFAGTSHEGIPKKKEVTEAIARVGKTPTKTETKQRKTQLIQLGMGEDFDVSTMTPQELNLRKQKASIEDRLADLRKRTIRTQKPQQKPQKQSSEMQNASYELEGELVDERTRYAKETGKSFKTGRSSVEGGDPEVAARNKPPLKYGGSRQAPKKRGQKPPVAGEPGSGRQDPAHMVAVRRANVETAKQQKIGSKYD